MLLNKKWSLMGFTFFLSERVAARHHLRFSGPKNVEKFGKRRRSYQRHRWETAQGKK
jgi:hypothetical protein